MVEQDSNESLSNILKATSDPTRRALLTLLVQHGAMRVTDLARHFEMSLNAVSKHIKVLEGAELVSRRTSWREHLIEANLEPIGEIDRWFAQLRSIWDMRLEALEQIVTEEMTMPDLSLTTSRKIAAPAKAIFEAWLDPDKLIRFMTPAPGVTVPKAVSDPVVGGRFELIMLSDGKELPHAGTYVEISRYSRLVFTWESPFTVEGSTVTLDFKETGGKTDVTLTHIRFPSEESRDNHASGWASILAALDATMSG